MVERFRNWVEIGSFERQATCFFKVAREKFLPLFLAFAAGYFTFEIQQVIQRMIQG